MKPESITISTPARLHITLIDLSKTGYRKNGGIGFSINEFGHKFCFEKSEDICLRKLVDAGFSAEYINRLEHNLRIIKCSHGKGGLYLASADKVLRNTGFGSGTGAALALIEGLGLINGIQLSREDMVKFSGRGGTSGIGINSYFDGGFILDAGRKIDSERFASSDLINNPKHLPLVLGRCEMPNWPIGIVVLPSVKPVTLQQEQNLFDEVLPISIEDVAKTSYLSIFGTYASVKENDFDSFSRSINMIQECLWKKSEIGLYNDRVLKAMLSLKDAGADCVGMSSIGPAIYFFARDFESVFAAAGNIFPPQALARATVNNAGRTISYA